MFTLFVLLSFVVVSIQIAIVLSRAVLSLVFIALDVAAGKHQARSLNAAPAAIAAPARADKMVARLA